MKIHKAVFILILAFACKQDSSLDVVTVSGNQLLINQLPYYMKGICYHPVPKGETRRDFGSIDQDLALMIEAGINTLRVYEPIATVEVLDKIKAAGLKVIINFGYNQEGKYDIRSGTYLDYINTFKNHEAILFWELGNEYNFRPEWFDGDIKKWYRVLNTSAEKIHELDAHHPVATAHGELPDSLALSMTSNIDIWGMNVYRWDQPSSLIEEWKVISKKPMYFSEVGADSYMVTARDEFQEGENQQAQAIANGKIIDEILRNTDANVGVFMFSFTDGWWKAGSPDQQDVGGWAPYSSGVPYDGAANEEYWGIVDIERNKKLTFNVIKEYFSKN